MRKAFFGSSIFRATKKGRSFLNSKFNSSTTHPPINQFRHC